MKISLGYLLSVVDSAQEENEEDIEGSNGPAVDAGK